MHVVWYAAFRARQVQRERFFADAQNDKGRHGAIAEGRQTCWDRHSYQDDERAASVAIIPQAALVAEGGRGKRGASEHVAATWLA